MTIEKALKANQRGSIAVNENIIRLYGLKAATIFGKLLARHYFHAENNELNGQGYFYYSANQLKDATGCDKRTQKREMKKLKEVGLIDFYQKAGQARRFRINVNATLKLFNRVQNAPTTGCKMPLHPEKVGAKSTGSNSSYITNNDCISSDIHKEKKTSNEVSEAADHFRQLFYKQMGYWPAKGQRKEHNIILKPLVERVGLKRLKGALDNWVLNEWVINNNLPLKHFVKYFDEYVPKKELIKFGECNECGLAIFEGQEHKHQGLCEKCNCVFYYTDEMGKENHICDENHLNYMESLKPKERTAISL